MVIRLGFCILKEDNMYETPMFVVVARPGTTFHDFETKLTFSSEPVEVTRMTPAIQQRLQAGGLKQVSAEGVTLNYKKPKGNPTTVIGRQSPGDETLSSIPATAKEPTRPAPVTKTKVVATPPAKPEAPEEPSLDDLLGDLG